LIRLNRAAKLFFKSPLRPFRFLGIGALALPSIIQAAVRNWRMAESHPKVGGMAASCVLLAALVQYAPPPTRGSA
jgi:hypothetical protein